MEEQPARFLRLSWWLGWGPFRQRSGTRNRGTFLSIIAIMTRARNAALILLCVLLAASASAQSKGNASINGKILDDQGKPAAAVLVRALKVGESTPKEQKTNDKGEWKLPSGYTPNFSR